MSPTYKQKNRLFGLSLKFGSVLSGIQSSQSFLLTLNSRCRLSHSCCPSFWSFDSFSKLRSTTAAGGGNVAHSCSSEGFVFYVSSVASSSVGDFGVAHGCSDFSLLFSCSSVAPFMAVAPLVGVTNYLETLLLYMLSHSAMAEPQPWPIWLEGWPVFSLWH